MITGSIEYGNYNDGWYEYVVTESSNKNEFKTEIETKEWNKHVDFNISFNNFYLKTHKEYHDVTIDHFWKKCQLDNIIKLIDVLDYFDDNADIFIQDLVSHYKDDLSKVLRVIKQDKLLYGTPLEILYEYTGLRDSSLIDFLSSDNSLFENYIGWLNLELIYIKDNYWLLIK